MEEGNQYEIFSQKNASNFKGFFNNPLIKRKGFNNFLIKCFVFYSPLKVAPSADYASLAFFSSYDKEAILKVNAKIDGDYYGLLKKFLKLVTHY